MEDTISITLNPTARMKLEALALDSNRKAENIAADIVEAHVTETFTKLEAALKAAAKRR